jgi:DNA-binding transcriptional ArsR family regulator
VATQGKTKRDGGGSGQRVSSPLMRALEHPLRREVLRILHTSSKPRSPSELSKELEGISLTAMAYHVRRLIVFDAVTKTHSRRVRGSTECFYRSTVPDHKVVRTILADTQEEDKRDKFGRRAPKHK